MSDKKKGGLDLLDKKKTKLQPPRKYKVILYNDDYTHMEFVINLLMDIFKKDYNSAKSIMLSVHKSGKGIAGVYSKEIAETKSNICNIISREKGFPLFSDIERE